MSNDLSRYQEDPNPTKTAVLDLLCTLNPDRSPTQSAVSGWCKELERFPIEKVQDACRKVKRTWKFATLPKPADVLQYLSEGQTNQAKFWWDTEGERWGGDEEKLGDDLEDLSGMVRYYKGSPFSMLVTQRMLRIINRLDPVELKRWADKLPNCPIVQAAWASERNPA